MKKSGFSLLELSIVLVIIGLLAGGILTGQSLIRAAELRSVIKDIERYTTSIHAFRDKYFALPGDMTNATAFWGAAHATPATCQTTVGTGTQTCNGNGDGWIGNLSSGQSYEWWRAWQHLANAGLIEGTYNGVASGGGSYDGTVGLNLPASKISNTGYAFYSFSWSASTYWYDYTGNLMTFGADRAGNNYLQDPAIATEEAWNIDMKIDDGLPGQGKIVAHKPTSLYTPNCTTDADPALSRYKLTFSGIACSLIVKLQ